MRKFLVIGLGALGRSLCHALISMGAEVVAVDHVMRRVEEIKDAVTYAQQVDATDEEALRSLDVPSFSAVVVAIGANFQSNLLASVLLKQLGAKRIITRATDPIHTKILRAVGMDQIVSPEDEVGERLAFQLLFSQVENMVKLLGDLNVAIFTAPASLQGKPVAELKLSDQHKLNLIALYQTATTEDGEQEESLRINPEGDVEIAEGERLILAGRAEELRRFWRRWE